MDFRDLDINRELQQQLLKNGISEPTNIQQLVIPKILSNREIIATSQTGSGKTLAFLLPIIQNLSLDSKSQCLIIAPTRELALQIGNVFDTLSNATEVNKCVIYGGVEYQPQIDALANNPQLIIATVGRLIDLIEQNALELNNLKYFILDEVDQMLDLGFKDNIIKLSNLRNKDSISLFFSATLTDDVIGICNSISSDLEMITINNQPLTVDKIEQIAYIVEFKFMEQLLVHIIRSEKQPHTIIFCRSRKMADKITTTLQENRFSAEAIHSDKSQVAREYILERFRNSETDILVATDVIARGIDIDSVELVVNMGLPLTPEQYVHRVGRTARAGRTGKAISLCTPDERKMVEKISILNKKNIPQTTNHPYSTPQLTIEMLGLKEKISKKTKYKNTIAQ